MADDPEGPQGERVSLSAPAWDEGKSKRERTSWWELMKMQEGVEMENIRTAFADVVIEKITSERTGGRSVFVDMCQSIRTGSLQTTASCS